MEVKYFNELSDKQVKFIAESNFNYWKTFNPALTYEQSVIPILQMKDNVKNLPVGIALFDNNEIVGFCTLRENRLEKYLHINPWICNVLIFEQYRGNGYGKQLVLDACQKLKERGYKKAYLWTDQAPDFYLKTGFRYEYKIEKNEGGFGDLFSKEL